MFRHVCLLLLHAIFSNSENFTFDENYFSYYNSSDYAILNDFSNVSCKNITKKKQFYVPKDLTEVNCTEACENAFERVTCASISLEDEPYFPKCCTPDHSYEENDHKCVKTERNSSIFDELKFAVTLIKSGLENCKVIADHHLENFDRFKIDNNGSMHFRNGVYPLDSYCLDKFAYSEGVILRTCHNLDICKRKENDGGIRCVKKCCPDGQIYTPSCSPAPGYGVPVKSNHNRFRHANDNFAVVITDKCRRYAANPTINYHVETNGSIFVIEGKVSKEYTLEETYYCLEYVEIFNSYNTMLCTVTDALLTKFNYTRIALIPSCVCLFLTIIGYLFLEELESLSGKIIVSYCISFFVFFVGMTIQQFRVKHEGSVCVIVGFVLFFFVIAAFTWMSIMSYDMWCVLGSMKTQYMNQKYREKKKFIWYSIFGWTVPIIVISISFINEKYMILPEYLRPIIGNNKCMLENKPKEKNYGYFLHLVLPIGAMTLFNIVIYTKTICYILKVKNEIARMNNLDVDESQRKRKIFNADKDRVIMALKIFLVMGVNWLFEVVSSIVYFPQNSTLEVIEVIFDTFNSLQGVIIFGIFMMKKKVLKAVLKKIGIENRIRKTSAVTLTSEVTMKSNPSSFIRKFRN